MEQLHPMMKYGNFIEVYNNMEIVVEMCYTVNIPNN